MVAWKKLGRSCDARENINYHAAKHCRGLARRASWTPFDPSSTLFLVRGGLVLDLLYDWAKFFLCGSVLLLRCSGGRVSRSDEF